MTRYRQIWAWTRFTLSEYARSGRIIVEMIAFVAFAWIFLRKPNQNATLTFTQFFGMVSVFVLAQTIYTSSVLVSMGNRAQGYVVLARPLGRKGYLIGLWLAALLIGIGNLLLCSLVAALVNPARSQSATPGIGIWFFGALPLLLDIALVAALVLFLSSLVLSSGWRLVMLAVLALASVGSTDVFSKIVNVDGPISRILAAVRTVVALPLTPLLAGFELSVQLQYSPQAVAIIGGQIALLVAVLAFAMFAFDRRDIILN
jgi:hypothetical protein